NLPCATRRDGGGGRGRRRDAPALPPPRPRDGRRGVLGARGPAQRASRPLQHLAAEPRLAGVGPPGLGASVRRGLAGDLTSASAVRRRALGSGATSPFSA